MKQFKLFGAKIFEWGEAKAAKPLTRDRSILPPAGRVSKPDIPSFNIETIGETFQVINPDFLFEIIPIIRSLCYNNPDVSQALDNIVQLGNTGHEVKFDASVDEKEANVIHDYLKIKKKQWSEGSSGMDGVVNKMIAQIMISGAVSGEWVPSNDLKGIDRYVPLNPENIRAVFNKKTQRYEFYQKLKNNIYPDRTSKDPMLSGLIKLNPLTYRYYALNGDTEIPYGIPPYLPSIGPLTRQKNMLDSLDYIVNQLGLMGFLAVMVEKPEKDGDESWPTYQARLETYLDQAKQRIQGGFKDGTVIGYKDDNEFDFHSLTKDFAGANDTFNNNELLVASSLKQDASLFGRSYGTTETQITVIFTKLLSQIKNIQAIIKRNLEFGYELDLRLAGFNFKTVEVEFKQSTILDELKYQQAQEIKIRNFSDLYYDGIISLDEYAQVMGFEAADEKDVRYLRNKVVPVDEAREKQKDASDKKVRDKNKPQPKTLK